MLWDPYSLALGWQVRLWDPQTHSQPLVGLLQFSRTVMELPDPPSGIPVVL